MNVSPVLTVDRLLSQAREVSQERERSEPGEEEQEERAERFLQWEDSEEIPSPLEGAGRILSVDLNYSIII